MLLIGESYRRQVGESGYKPGKNFHQECFSRDPKRERSSQRIEFPENKHWNPRLECVLNDAPVRAAIFNAPSGNRTVARQGMADSRSSIC